MEIVVLSKWFEEIELAPFFFSHYDYADEFWIYLDSYSNDGSVEFLNTQPKVKIFWGEGDGKLNDFTCCEDLSSIALTCQADWLIYADADEFVFPVGMTDPRKILANANGNLIYSHMWDMYRHIDDAHLDPADIPIVLQRRHGDPVRIPECTKPNIIRPEIGIHWNVGCHGIVETKKEIIPSSVRFDGAHWQSVDFELACRRRIKGVRDRLSEMNREMKWAHHNFNVTEKEIAKLMKQHENDPQLF